MQTRDIREPDAEGKDGEVEEPESPSDDVAQEEDENDNFGEDADWSDEEEGNECDIIEQYNLVWSEGWQEEPKAYERNSITIYGSAHQNPKDEPHPIHC